MRNTYRRRRRITRRRARAGTAWTVDSLLRRQPKSLSRSAAYPAMMRALERSPGLKEVVLPRRCATILQTATIRPEHIPDLIATYRLPKSEFFPLFLASRREYLEHRDAVRRDRDRYVLNAVRALPPHRLAAIKYLGRLECSVHPARDCPVWNRWLFPSSKRAADRYSRHDDAEWSTLFRAHLHRLCERYRTFSLPTAERVMAYLLLHLIPSEVPPGPLAPQSLAVAYRRLSMEHHPDRGGDPVRFIELKRARDLLARGW